MLCLEFFHRLDEIVRLLKAPVDARISHVGHLIDLAQATVGRGAEPPNGVRLHRLNYLIRTVYCVLNRR